MNKFIIATAFGIIASAPLMASNSDDGCPEDVAHQGINPLIETLAAFDVHQEEHHDPSQTMQQYINDQVQAYKEGIENYAALAKQGKERVVTEVIEPRTEIYIPCKDGLLRYKFLKTTSVLNSYLHNFIMDWHGMMKQVDFTDFKGGFVKSAGCAFFDKQKSTFQKLCGEIVAYQQILENNGVVPLVLDEGSMLFAFNSEQDEDTQKIIFAASIFLSEQGELQGDQTAVAQGVIDSISNPSFIRLKEVNKKGAAFNFRGVVIH